MYADWDNRIWGLAAIASAVIYGDNSSLHFAIEAWEKIYVYFVQPSEAAAGRTRRVSLSSTCKGGDCFCTTSLKVHAWITYERPSQVECFGWVGAYSLYKRCTYSFAYVQNTGTDQTSTAVNTETIGYNNILRFRVELTDYCLPRTFMTYVFTSNIDILCIGLKSSSSLSSDIFNVTSNATHGLAAELSAEFIWNHLYNGTIIMDTMNLQDCSYTPTTLATYNSGKTIEGLSNLVELQLFLVLSSAPTPTGARK